MDGFHHNLISVSQLCKNQMIIEFTRIGCNILDEELREVFLVRENIQEYIYIYIYMWQSKKEMRSTCGTLDWVGHLCYHNNKKTQVFTTHSGIAFEPCETYIKSKKVKSIFDEKIELSNNRPLELFYIEFFSPN